METLDDVEHRIDAHRLIARAKVKMSDRELQVLTWRFGLGDEQLTLQECGDRLGRSRERVRQMEARAIRRLRREAGLHERLWSEPVRERERIIPARDLLPAAVAPLATPSAEGGLLAGDLVLTCDTCTARFVSRIPHKGGRVGTYNIDLLRKQARAAGWHIEGGDHCPQCVSLPRFVEVERRLTVDSAPQSVE